MSTNYIIDKNKNLFNGWGTQFCDQTYSAKLAANTSTAVPVPNDAAAGALAESPVVISGVTQTYNKFYAKIHATPGVDVFYSLGTAAAPAGGTFAATTSALLPPDGICKYVKGGDSIHFISSGTPNVTVEFYANPQ
jgi:hypothetical protein